MAKLDGSGFCKADAAQAHSRKTNSKKSGQHQYWILLLQTTSDAHGVRYQESQSQSSTLEHEAVRVRRATAQKISAQTTCMFLNSTSGKYLLDIATFGGVSEQTQNCWSESTSFDKRSGPSLSFGMPCSCVFCSHVQSLTMLTELSGINCYKTTHNRLMPLS